MQTPAPVPRFSAASSFARSNRGAVPVAEAYSKNSIISSRRSPFSIFATNDWGLCNFAANVVCVRPRSILVRRSSSRRISPSRL